MAVRPTTKRPGHTCPDIDAAIEALRSASRDAVRAANRSEDDAAADALRDAEGVLDSVQDDLEKLRKANAALRDSAEEWEAYALELEDEIAKAEERAEQLERAAAGEF